MAKKYVCWMPHTKQQSLTCQAFLCINTNVGYSTVGCFITADETKASIKRGLQYLKKWNGNWNPQAFMTDFDQSEIGALEETFTGINIK